MYFKPVVVTQLDQVVCNVQTILVSVLVMQATKGQNVMQLVVVIPLVQAAQLAINLQVNVLAILATQVQHVILALQITTEQVVELVQVSFIDNV